AIVAGLQSLVPHFTQRHATHGALRGDDVVHGTLCGLIVAIPALAVGLMLLPAVSLLIVGSAVPHLGVFGAALAIAWLVNIAAAPAFFANLAEGRVQRNWVAQGAMCLLNMLLVPVGGFFAGATGVVVATSCAVALGSVLTLLTRHGDFESL